MKPAPKSCALCGKTFEKPDNYSMASWRKRKFCGRVCSGKQEWTEDRRQKNRTKPDARKKLQGYVPEPNTGCWLWLERVDSDGYPYVRHKVNGRTVNVRMHREAINCPPGKLAIHSCDTPSCVNPAHLRAGSQSDNMRDVVQRKRRIDWRERYELALERLEELCLRGAS